MMPHCQHYSQFELFAEFHPAECAPKLELPFQGSAQIDLKRLQRILGIDPRTMRRMIHEKAFRSFCGPSGRRIEYDSVVDFCNKLRVEFGISACSAKPRLGRMRDRDLLPFPLDETIGVPETCAILDCSVGACIGLIDEGKLVAYKIRNGHIKCPWRIHRPSLERYIASLHAQARTSFHHGASSR
jgi:hypothetical protein